MNVIARVAFQPGLHFVNLVRAVVVHDQVHVWSCRKIAFNFVEKLQELMLPVPPAAVADGDA